MWIDLLKIHINQKKARSNIKIAKKIGCLSNSVDKKV